MIVKNMKKESAKDKPFDNTTKRKQDVKMFNR